MKILERGSRFVPVIMVMGTIFFLSHQHGGSLPFFKIPGLDKLAHMAVYALLAAAAVYTAPVESWRERPWSKAVLVVLFCLLYGVTDEYHQTFVPGRQASLGDLLADAAGAAGMVALWLHRLRSKS